MPYDLSACGLVTVSTSRFVACALGSHIFGNPNVSNDGTVIIGTVVNGTALSLTDGAAAHTYFKFNTTCGSVIESDSRLTFITSGAPNALVLTGGNVGIGTASPTAKLHINGSSQFDDSLNFASRGKLSWGGSPARLILTSCGSYNLALGTDDFVDRMTIQCGTGNVGIGTTSPTTGKLEVSGSILTSGGLVAALANSAALSFESTFSRLIAFGTDASTNGCFRLISSRSDGSNQLTWLAGNASGNVGINCLTPTYKLHVNGTFYAAGSSQDYKQSICNYNTDSCMFMKLKPVMYQYKEEYCHLGKELKSGTQIGLIAEEVAESHPELAILVNEEDEKVVRNVDYEKLTIILLSELQKLRQEVDQLKNK